MLLSDEELMDMYTEIKQNPVCPDDTDENKSFESKISDQEEKASPIIVRRTNPFKKPDDINEISPSLISKVRKRLPVKRASFKSTVIDEKAVSQSKFFAPKRDIIPETEEEMEITESMVPNIDTQDNTESLEELLSQTSSLSNNCNLNVSQQF